MIRDTTENDIPAILDIYNEAVINTTAIYEYRPHTLEDRMAWFRKKLAEGYPVRVCLEGDIVAGYSTYGQFRSFPAYKYTIEHSIYVRKDYRRRQIGSLLLKDLVEIAGAKGCAAMIGVIDGANSNSILMHEKFGFVKAGTLHSVGYKFGRWLDIVFYEYKLKGPEKPAEG
jgi:L-amino acid N-acyltransferase